MITGAATKVPRNSGQPPQQTLDAFGDTEHGAEAVALAYRGVIKEAGEIAARRNGEAARKRWDPVVEIMVEFAGALLSILYDPTGTGGNVFRLVRPLADGVATRSAKAVFHLVIGRVTRSRGQSHVDNSLRVLDTRLDRGRRDWQEFIRALEREGFRDAGRGDDESETVAAMEKSAEG